MIGGTSVPDWLSSDYLLSQFSVQRKTTIRKYREFVQKGLKEGPIWSQLNNLIYLGDRDFLERIQRHIKPQKKESLQIPNVQNRPVAKTIREYEQMSSGRDEAIITAYDSGAYSYQDLGDYFG